MRHLVLPVLALAASCSFPQHVARRTVEETVPAGGIGTIDCTSHNGDITVEGRPGAADIKLRVVISVRGYTPEEAAANLEQLSVRRETDGDRLVLVGEYDRALSRMSPSFTFVIEAPPEIASRLVSHNGDITALGIAAAVDCETHNGDIEASARTDRVRFLSHNGDLDVRLDGAGPLDGSMTTHNGDVHLAVGDGVDATIRASTHNGRVRLSREAAEASSSRRRLDCRIGDGRGRLAIETHNGTVEIR